MSAPLRVDGAAISWKVDAEVMGVTALCIGDAFAAWSANNPSVFTVRTFRSNAGKDAENTAGDIRLGSVLGSVVAIIVGAGGTLVTESWWPLLGTILMLLYEWLIYEWALANPHGVRSSISDQ